MSDKKFNLKNYKKINGDEHIDMRLEQSREEAPNVINEKQLEVGRVKEKNVTVEKLLEDKRTGGETEITEKRLDTHKAKFANKYRNPEAFEGDINKLEEKRLENDPVEKEEYKAASEVASQFRWWEDVKSPDGLKLAQKKTVKTAQSEYEGELGDVYDSLTAVEPSERNLKQLTEDYDASIKEAPQENFIDKIEEQDDTEENIIVDTVRIDKDKDIFQPKSPNSSGIYFTANFDPREFPLEYYIDQTKGQGGADIARKNDIKQEMISQIAERRPELAQKLQSLDPNSDIFDYFQIDEKNGHIKAALVGEEWIPYMKDFISTPAMVDTQKSRVVSDDFAELSYEQKNIDGTPMALGKLQILEEDIGTKNIDAITSKAVEFLRKNHPEIDIEKDSLDLSKIDAGEIVYMASVSPEAAEKASKGRMTAEEELAATEARMDEWENLPEWKQLGYDSEAEWAEDQAEIAQEETIPEEDIPITDLDNDEYTETEEEWKERLRQMEEAKKASPTTAAVKKN